MTISVEQIQGLTGGGKVVSDGGDQVGHVGQVYLNDQSGEPAWVTVKTGLFGTAESFVPLDGARVEDDLVVVAFDKETIKEAPRVEADGSITPEEEQRLYRHYGLRSPAEGPGRDDTRTEATEAPAADHVSDDNAVTRSEEQLRIGTETQVAGRAVLRKYVVTEYVTQTVPVRREELRLEHEPITDDNRHSIADDGAEAFGDEADLFEVVLHKEVPVVRTETVPVERVRVRKAVVTDEASVSDHVRQEQIAVDDPTDRSDRDGIADESRDGLDRDGLDRDGLDRDDSTAETRSSVSRDDR